jgi:hypothetical protein
MSMMNSSTEARLSADAVSIPSELIAKGVAQSRSAAILMLWPERLMRSRCAAISEIEVDVSLGPYSALRDCALFDWIVADLVG